MRGIIVSGIQGISFVVHSNSHHCAFAHELGFAMEMRLCSCANVHEVMEVLEVIDATGFTTLPEQWRDCHSLLIYHHPGTNQTRRRLPFLRSVALKKD